MAVQPVEIAEAWAKAEHEAELLRVSRYLAMPMRDRLLALERRGRLLARMRERGQTLSDPPDSGHMQ